jgi:glycosyltransferase involved in cell wall biosynthesis
MITYNQEAFITEALRGVLMQEMDGEIEFIIADDNSPDNTQQIVKAITAEHPKSIHIRYTRHSENKGMVANFKWAIQQATGKYVAICDGDDYWTDPHKLQKQVDFLNNNSDYVLCFHEVSVLTPDNELKKDFITCPPKDVIDIVTLAQYGNFIHTPSIVFRNMPHVFPDNLLQSPIGDYCLQMVLAESGNFKILHDNMAVYRFGSGIWSSQDSFTSQLKTAKTHMILAGYFESRHNASIMNILLDRVLQFTYRNSQDIKREHLDFLIKDCLCISEWINASIFRYEKLSNRVIILEQQQIENITTKQLIQIAARRIVNKLKVGRSK